MATNRWSGDRFRPPQLSDGVIRSVRVRDTGADSYVEPTLGGSSPRSRGNALGHPTSKTTALHPDVVRTGTSTNQERAQAERVATAVAMSAIGRESAPGFGFSLGTATSIGYTASTSERLDEFLLLSPSPPSAQMVAMHSTRLAEPSATAASGQLQDQSVRGATERSCQHRAADRTTESRASDSVTSATDTHGRTKSERRREQCRANQARYRAKQRMMQIELAQSLDRLRDEVQELEARRRGLARRQRSKLSAWNVVADYFRLFCNGASVGSSCAGRIAHASEDLDPSDKASVMASNTAGIASQFLQTPQGKEQLAFLRSVMDPEVCLVGSKNHGVDALLGHWVRWARCFSTFGMELERVENARGLPSALKATARVSVTLSESTMHEVFPSLFFSRRANNNGGSDADLARRLRDQRVEFNYAMWFESDPRSCKVLRLRSQLDLVPALLRALGSLGAVAQALDGSRLTAEGFLLLGNYRNNAQSPRMRNGSSDGCVDGERLRQ